MLDNGNLPSDNISGSFIEILVSSMHKHNTDSDKICRYEPTSWRQQRVFFALYIYQATC